MKKIITLFLVLSVILTSSAVSIYADNTTYAVNWTFEDGVANVFNPKNNGTLSIVNDVSDNHLKIQAQNGSAIADLKHYMPQNAGLSGAILFEMDFKTSGVYEPQSFAVEFNNNDTTNGGEPLTLVGLGKNNVLELGNYATNYKYSLNTWYNIKLYLRLGEDKASHKIRADITKENGESTTLYVAVPDRGPNIWKDPNLTHDYVRTFYFVGAWNQIVTEIDNVKFSKWDCDLSDDFFTNDRALYRFDEEAIIPEYRNTENQQLYVKPNQAPNSAESGIAIDGRKALRFINNSGTYFPELFYNVSTTKQPYASFDFKLAKGGFWFSVYTNNANQDILLSVNADKANQVYIHGDSTSTGTPVAYSNGIWYRAAFSFDYTAKTFTVKLFNLEDNTTVVTGTYPLVKDYFTQLNFFAWYTTELYVDNLIYGNVTDLRADFTANDVVENHLSDGAILTFSNPIDPTNQNNSVTIDGTAVQAVDANASLGIRVPLAEVGKECSVEYTLYDIYGQSLNGTATVKAIDDYYFTSFNADATLAAPSFTASATGRVYSGGTAKLMVAIYEKDTNELKTVNVLNIGHEADEENYTVAVTVPTELAIDKYIAKAFLWQGNNTPIEIAIVR